MGLASSESTTFVVSTIIVTYRTATWVERSLRALAGERARLENVDLRVTVIDNASGDAPILARLVAEHGWEGWVKILRAERNGGFAYGNNVGLRHAYASDVRPDYFLFLNPDTEVREGAIGALVEALERNLDAGAASSRLEFEDGEPWPYAFRFPSVWSEVNTALGFGPVAKLLAHKAVLRRMPDGEPREVDWASGSAFMVRRDVIDTLGGMDERYFLYFEETDFFLRMRQAGWRTLYVPSSRVMHAAGKSTGLDTTKPARLPTYWFESRRRYFAKNHGAAYAAMTDVAFVAALALGRLKRRLTGKLGGEKPHLARDVLRHSVLHPHHRAPTVRVRGFWIDRR